MTATRSIEHASEKASNAVGSMVALPVETLVRTITGENPLGHAKQTATQSLTDLALFPGRVFWHGSMGLLKGSAKLAWKGITHLPIFPVWKEERNRVTGATRRELAVLQQGIAPPPDSADFMAESLRIAA